jgi:hypothetical protein
MQRVQKYCCFSFSPVYPIAQLRWVWWSLDATWCCPDIFGRVMDTRQHPFHFRLIGFSWINHKAAKWRGKLETSVVWSFDFVNNLWFQWISTSDFLKIFKINRTSSLGIFEKFPRTGRVLWKNWKKKNQRLRVETSSNISFLKCQSRFRTGSLISWELPVKAPYILPALALPASSFFKKASPTLFGTWNLLTDWLRSLASMLGSWKTVREV